MLDSKTQITPYFFAREGMSRDCHGLVIPPLRVTENLQSRRPDHARRFANKLSAFVSFVFPPVELRQEKHET